MKLAQTLATASLAGVAVFLLVAAVELDEVLVRVVELLAVAGQLRRDGPRSPRLVSLIFSTGDRFGSFAGDSFVDMPSILDPGGETPRDTSPTLQPL